MPHLCFLAVPKCATDHHFQISVEGDDDMFAMLDFIVFYPVTWVAFGYPKDFGSFKSWIMQWRDMYGVKETWAINKWTHVCMAYEKRSGVFKVVKVRKDRTCLKQLSNSLCSKYLVTSPHVHCTSTTYVAQY